MKNYNAENIVFVVGILPLLWKAYQITNLTTIYCLPDYTNYYKYTHTHTHLKPNLLL